MVSVDEILSSVSPSQKTIIEKLRSLIKKVVPEAVEKVRQKKIAYAVGGKDFVWINPFTDHVDLDFMCGARLLSGDLKGRGKKGTVQHLEIADENDINEEKIKKLIEEASEAVC